MQTGTHPFCKLVTLVRLPLATPTTGVKATMLQLLNQDGKHFNPRESAPPTKCGATTTSQYGLHIMANKMHAISYVSRNF